MIASKIGRTLLNAYNKKHNKNYSAKEFFEKEFFELFYNHPKYMQWITNSPFVQGVEGFGGEYGFAEIVKDDEEKSIKFSKKEEDKFLGKINTLKKEWKDNLLGFKVKMGNSKKEVYPNDNLEGWLTKDISQLKLLKKINQTQSGLKLNDFHNKISEINKPDASIVIGYPASNEKGFATTSGQVSNISMPFEEDVAYLSWIGNGCGIGVKGGLSIYFDVPDILMKIYEGWKVYRNEYLNNSSYEKLVGNQIDTWNGQWITYVFGVDFSEELALSDFSPTESKKDKDGNVISLNIALQTWTNITFAVANKFSNTTITGYIYKLGKTNSTVGFIPFNLPEVRKPIQLYKVIFGENEYLKSSKQIESLYGNPDAFMRACEMGSIGIKALKPKDLEGYVFPDRKGEFNYPDIKHSKIRKQKVKEKESDEKYNDYVTKTKEKNRGKIIKFRTYITWIIAMLNENEKLWDRAKSYAQTLRDYESSDKKLSTKRANNVKNILEKPYKKGFISTLTELLKDKQVDSKTIYELANDADKMPKDNFPYFLTLIRFHYTYLKNQSSNK